MTFDAQEIAREAAERGEDQVASVVGQLAGFASVCWEDMSGTGVFRSDDAKAAVDSTLAFLRGELDRPNLGLATTRELLDEVRCRVEVDYFAGGGGLDYTTVRGRPGGNLLAGGHSEISPPERRHPDAGTRGWGGTVSAEVVAATE